MRILDVMGRRLMVQFTDGLTETRYLWHDGQQVIYEEVSGLTEPYRYVWGNGIDEALLRFGNGDIWYLDNQLGSVMALSDDTGQLIERYGYDVYGAVTVYDATGQQIPVTNYDNRYLFTGREYNWHTGLYHYRARTYHPRLGRFLSRDPLYPYAQYRYALICPTVFADPSGAKVCAKGAVEEFVRLFRLCGARVEAKGCCSDPQYTTIVWTGAPPGKGNVFGWFVHLMTGGKPEAFFRVNKGPSGGTAFIGSFGAQEQTIWLGDLSGLRAALPMEPSRTNEAPSICELLLHELAERWCAVTEQKYGKKKVVPAKHWMSGKVAVQERVRYWYNVCHEFALDVQSLYRLSKGVENWLVVGYSGKAAPAMGAVVGRRNVDVVIVRYGNPYRIITVDYRLEIQTRIHRGPRGPGAKVRTGPWRLVGPARSANLGQKEISKLANRIRWVIRKWQELQQ